MISALWRKHRRVAFGGSLWLAVFVSGCTEDSSSADGPSATSLATSPTAGGSTASTPGGVSTPPPASSPTTSGSGGPGAGPSSGAAASVGDVPEPGAGGMPGVATEVRPSSNGGTANGGSSGAESAGTAPDATGGSGGVNAGGGGGTNGGGGTAGGGEAGSGEGGGGAGGSGGQAAGGAGGSADAGDAFAPCPDDGSPCKIMPLGDSITDGVGSSGGGYRVDLFRRALTDGLSVTFVGSGMNGPNMVEGQPFPRNHEGHSGFTIEDGGGRSGIAPLLGGALGSFQPHIITLMIGTNDVDINLDLQNAPTRLGRLLDSIWEGSPDALVVVAQIVPSTDDNLNNRIQTYNAAIPELVQSRADAGMHVVLVDMYSAYTAEPNYKQGYMNDRLHPNDAGYVVMAGVWYEAISEYLPLAP